MYWELANVMRSIWEYIPPQCLVLSTFVGTCPPYLSRNSTENKHSKNKIFTNFESEAGSGVVQFIIQRTSPCKKSRQQRQNQNVVSFLHFVHLIFFRGHVCWRLDWSITCPISFPNSIYCVITLFSEYSIDSAWVSFGRLSLNFCVLWGFVTKCNF